MKKSNFKTYIGDGVYADFDGFNIILTTNNGITTSNIIVLEPEVIRSFNDYMNMIKKKLEKTT